MLLSIAKLRELYGCNVSQQGEADSVERYLHRYRSFIDYVELKLEGYTIDSGLVELACKQIISEGMKLSGMRWHM